MKAIRIVTLLACLALTDVQGSPGSGATNGFSAAREGMARDSGILYHIQGEQKVWPTSIEFQICEGQTGDFYMTDGAALTGADGKRETGPRGSAARIRRFGEGPWQNVTGYRDPTGEI